MLDLREQSALQVAKAYKAKLDLPEVKEYKDLLARKEFKEYREFKVR
jgi:hypothetical protein